MKINHICLKKVSKCNIIFNDLINKIVLKRNETNDMQEMLND